jgi:hypothetical protein
MAHLEKQGGLAQLVERLLCKQDVNGSSPLTSTEVAARWTDVVKLIERRIQHLILHWQESLLNLAFSENLENCIVTCQVEDESFSHDLSNITDTNVE